MLRGTFLHNCSTSKNGEQEALNILVMSYIPTNWSQLRSVSDLVPWIWIEISVFGDKSGWVACLVGGLSNYLNSKSFCSILLVFYFYRWKFLNWLVDWSSSHNAESVGCSCFFFSNMAQGTGIRNTTLVCCTHIPQAWRTNELSVELYADLQWVNKSLITYVILPLPMPLWPDPK